MKPLPEGFIRDTDGGIIDVRTLDMPRHGFDDFVELIEALRRTDANNLGFAALQSSYCQSAGNASAANEWEMERVRIKGHMEALDTVLKWAEDVQYMSIDNFRED